MKAKQWIMMVCVTSAMLGVGSQAYASKDCDLVVAKGVLGHKLLKEFLTRSMAINTKHIVLELKQQELIPWPGRVA